MGQRRLTLARLRRKRELPHVRDERRGGRPAGGERVADGLDLRRRRAATPAHDSRPERHRLRGELAEVLGRRVWEDDPARR